MPLTYIEFWLTLRTTKKIQGYFMIIKAKMETHIFLLIILCLHIYAEYVKLCKIANFLYIFSYFWNCPRTIDTIINLYMRKYLPYILIYKASKVKFFFACTITTPYMLEPEL